MSESIFPKTRLPSLDVLRGLNIAAMIVFHYNLIYFPQPVDAITTAIHWMGGHVAALFFFLSGAGAYLFLRHGLPVKLFRRGIFLFAVATLVSIFPKGHYYIEWTVIQDIGFAFMLLAIIARFTSQRFLMGLGLYVAFGVISLILDISVVGFFSFFPTVIFFLIGYGFASMCPMWGRGALVTSQAGIALSACLVVSVGGFLIGAFTSDARLAWYADALEKNGAFMLLYFIFVWVLGRWQFADPLGTFFVEIGRVPLTIYYLQQVLLRFLQSIGFQVIVVSLFISYLLLMSSVFVLVFILLSIWRRYNFALSLEWMMRQL